MPRLNNALELLTDDELFNDNDEFDHEWNNTNKVSYTLKPLDNSLKKDFDIKLILFQDKNGKVFRRGKDKPEIVGELPQETLDVPFPNCGENKESRKLSPCQFYAQMCYMKLFGKQLSIGRCIAEELIMQQIERVCFKVHRDIKFSNFDVQKYYHIQDDLVPANDTFDTIDAEVGPQLFFPNDVKKCIACPHCKVENLEADRLVTHLKKCQKALAAQAMQNKTGGKKPNSQKTRVVKFSPTEVLTQKPRPTEIFNEEALEKLAKKLLDEPRSVFDAATLLNQMKKNVKCGGITESSKKFCNRKKCSTHAEVRPIVMDILEKHIKQLHLQASNSIA